MPNKTYHPRGLSIHGYSVKKHPLRAVWEDMKQRCSNPNNPAWKDYGGRGITYCSSWEHFANFALDMWPRPDGLELDRLDNNKGYSKENCAWTDRSGNCGNRRVFKNNTLGVAGVRMERDGVFSCLYHKHSIRYRLGWFDSADAATSFREWFKNALKEDPEEAKRLLLSRPHTGVYSLEPRS